MNKAAAGHPKREFRYKPVLTSGDVAALFHCSARTAMKLVDSGALGGFRLPLSRDRRVHARGVYEFLRNDPQYAGILDDFLAAAAAAGVVPCRAGGPKGGGGEQPSTHTELRSLAARVAALQESDPGPTVAVLEKTVAELGGTVKILARRVAEVEREVRQQLRKGL